MDCQNLVGNPYFDRDPGKACFDLKYNGWEAMNGTTQLQFDECQSKPPSQILATVGLNNLPDPFIGTGYMGIIAIDAEFIQPNGAINRHFLSSYLNGIFQPGEKYVVEFRYRPWYRNNYFVDRLEVFVGDTALDEDNYHLYSPTVGIQEPIIDTVQWRLFKKEFISQGGETILNIGVLSHDSLINMIPNPPNISQGNSYNWNRWPMIFIDAVFLYKATDTLYTVTLPQDTTLCPNETLNLVAQLDSGFKLKDTVTTYLWNNGSTDSTLLVTAPGTIGCKPPSTTALYKVIPL